MELFCLLIVKLQLEMHIISKCNHFTPVKTQFSFFVPVMLYFLHISRIGMSSLMDRTLAQSI